jgi:hypothetical protein
MGSVGVKTPIEPKLYLFFSILRHFEQDEVDVMCLFFYNMDGKIRIMSMNITFKYICKKN